MSISPERVHQLLNPTSVAVVGASDGSPWSRGFMENLRSFQGEIFLVNPRRETAFGRRTYPTLQDIGTHVDHAVVLVAAGRVAGVLRDAAASGITSATVIASGFSESGAEGRALAEEVAAIAAEHEIAVIGPNCFGFNNYSGTYISRYNLDVPSEPGSIGMSFQSGKLGAATADSASARGIHLRYVVSSGNELVVDSNDYLEYFIESDDITVAGGVYERIPDPPRFERLATRALELGKPIVLLKPGRSAAASRIAIAHTGAVTGEDRITDAFLNDLGVIRVGSVEELAETAGLLASRGWPRGRRTVFIGFSGGAAELFAEQAEATSIVLDPHSDALRERLADVSTLDQDVIHNPFDFTVDGAVHYEAIVETLAASKEYDIIVSQGTPRRSFEAPDPSGTLAAQRQKFSGALARAASEHDVMSVFLDTSDQQPGIGVFSSPAPNGAYYALGNNGVKAISNAIDYGIRRAEVAARVLDAKPPLVDPELVPDLSAHAGAMSESASKDLLRAYGVPTTEDVLVATRAEAVAAAESMGYPVVLKVVATDLPHKSDAGGVALNLSGPEHVSAAWESICESVAQYSPGSRIEGVIVSRFVAGGTEFIAGIQNDQHLGPVVVAGAGGLLVEVLDDVTLLRPPFSLDDALAALGALRSSPLLDGVRGMPALDKIAFADALCRLGHLALDHRETLLELDINPLFVFPAGQGVLAADALVVTSDHSVQTIQSHSYKELGHA